MYPGVFKSEEYCVIHRSYSSSSYPTGLRTDTGKDNYRSLNAHRSCNSSLGDVRSFRRSDRAQVIINDTLIVLATHGIFWLDAAYKGTSTRLCSNYNLSRCRPYYPCHQGLDMNMIHPYRAAFIGPGLGTTCGITLNHDRSELREPVRT